MTRRQLKKRNDKRTRFHGTFERYGVKRGWQGREERTILLKSIVEVESGQLVAPHLWFNLTKGFAALGELHEGDQVEFDARVTRYVKGYQGRRAERLGEAWRATDYKLSRPTKIARRGEQ